MRELLEGKTGKEAVMQRNVLLRGITVLLLALPGTAGAATLTVDCNAAGKLQTALNAAANGDTILVSGICNENVSVRDELVRVTIDGQGTATVHATSAGAAAIQVLGRNITIKGFTITGGRTAITVLR